VLLRLAVAAAVVAALAGCGGSAKKPAKASQLPPGCTAAETDGIVTAFLRSPTFAPKPDFDVYASYESDGRSFVSHSIANAVAHVRQRLALGERDRLLSLRVGKQDFNHVRIAFTLTRFAPDFRKRGIHTRLAQGAGTVDCAHGRVAAWVVKGP
jgi:hypothetical protein